MPEYMEWPIMLDPVPHYTVAQPQDLLGAVPFLVGYHPEHELIVLFVAANARISCLTRVGLDDAGSDTAQGLAALAAKAELTAAFVIGYGPAPERGKVAAVADLLNNSLPVLCQLLVADGRCYCVLEGCRCPASSGMPFDASSTATAAAMVSGGAVALPSRRDMLALADPDHEAQQAIADIIATMSLSADAAPVVLQSMLEQAEAGNRLTDQQAARLALALAHLSVRDQAWQATDKQMWQRDLWLDMTRRLPETHVAPAANLAAWSAWRHGDETLARAALHRALDADPGNSMSTLIDTLLDQHLPPSEIDWPIPAAQLCALHERWTR